MTPELSALEALLELEAEILRAGDIDRLQDILSKKEIAWSKAQRQLSRADALPDLAKIQETAQRNARLLLAAHAGLDAARQKTTKAKMPRKALTTYTAQGQKEKLGIQVNTTEKLG